MIFSKKYDNHVETVNSALEKYLNQKEVPQKIIYEAMQYSLISGGKRVRPVLCLAVSEIFNGNSQDALPFACAIEMIHTYSLIHDDLPCMDNDDFRRGRLTNHKVYGENTAVLAGDALLNYAFEIMLDACKETSLSSLLADKKLAFLKNKIAAAAAIAEASGVSGMIGGQVVDMQSEGKEISKDTLLYMHEHKTGALIKASVLSSALINNASDDELASLTEYAESLGMAFQIKDDILDVEGDSEVLGKPIGSDSGNKKTTFVTLFGIDESKNMLEKMTQKAIDSLDIFRENAEFLRKLAEYLSHRVK